MVISVCTSVRRNCFQGRLLIRARCASSHEQEMISLCGRRLPRNAIKLFFAAVAAFVFVQSSLNVVFTSQTIRVGVIREKFNIDRLRASVAGSLMRHELDPATSAQSPVTLHSCPLQPPHRGKSTYIRLGLNSLRFLLTVGSIVGVQIGVGLLLHGSLLRSVDL